MTPPADKSGRASSGAGADPGSERQVGRPTFTGRGRDGAPGVSPQQPGSVAKQTEFQRRAPERPENPRRVRGGLRVDAKTWPPELGPLAAPFAALVDALSTNEMRSEAFNDYALRGQTKQIDFTPGAIEAIVQGRRYRPYTVRLQIETYPADRWDRFISGLDVTPALPAKLLAGEVPVDVIVSAEAAGVPLHPGADEVSRTTDSKEGGSFDKHAACALMLTAEAVERDPFLLFVLRGLSREELTERLRQRRAVRTSSTGSAAAYAPQPLPDAEVAEEPLDAGLDAASFYDAGPELRELELPLRRPEIAHPLLRRLGPSPFAEGRFPLVGLLATCYESISHAALTDRSSYTGRHADAADGGERPASPVLERADEGRPAVTPAEPKPKPKGKAKPKARKKL